MVDPDAVIEFMKTIPAVNLIIRSLGLLKMFLFSCKTKDFDLLRSSCRLLDNFLFMGNSKCYPKIRLFEEIENSVLDKKVVEFLMTISLIKCVGEEKWDFADGKFEKINRQLKNLVGNPTFENWINSSVLFEDLRKVKNIGHSTLLIKDYVRSLKKTSHVLDDIYLRIFIRESKFFHCNFTYISVAKKTTSFPVFSIDQLEALLEKRKNEFVEVVKRFIIKKKAIKLPPIELIEIKREDAKEDEDDDEDEDEDEKKSEDEEKEKLTSDDEDLFFEVENNDDDDDEDESEMEMEIEVLKDDLNSRRKNLDDRRDLFFFEQDQAYYPNRFFEESEKEFENSEMINFHFVYSFCLRSHRLINSKIVECETVILNNFPNKSKSVKS